MSSWPLVVAVSWQGRGCPRKGCWPARLHSLRLIIFTRGLSSVRAPENRSFLFPFPPPPLPPPPFATVLSLSTIYHVFARQFQMFNSFSRREKLFFFYCSSTISGTSFDRKKEIQGVEADREIDQFSR